jgi:hypothetical protein
MERLNSPTFSYKTAYWILFILGGLNILVGFATLVFKINILTGFGVFLAILFGSLFFVLGYFTKKGSVSALISAMVIYALSVASNYFIASANGTPPAICGFLSRLCC